MTVETSVPFHDEQNHQAHDAPKKRGIPFFTRPVQRQRWEDTQIHPVVNWGDLFFDLFYVAAAYNLGIVVLESPTLTGLLYFCGLFWAVLYMWLDKMFYDSRFYTQDDIWHQFFEVGVLVVLATAVLHIRPVEFMSNPSKYVDTFAFSLTCVVANLCTIWGHVEIYFWVDGGNEAKLSARRDMINKVFPTIFYLAAAIVAGMEYYSNPSENDQDGGGYRSLADENGTEADSSYTSSSSSSYQTTNVPIWLICGASAASIVWQTLVVVLLPRGGRHKERFVPMNIDFAIHRYGEWTMLMLGESVLSLLIVEVSGGARYYGTFYLGVLSVILLQYLHFRSQPHHPDDHAMRRDKNAGWAFALLMQVYSAALILLGVSYKMFLYEYVYEDAEDGSDGAQRRRTLFGVMDSNMLSRFLAGGGASAALQYDTQDRQQRNASFFCASLAIVFVCIDAMLVTHKGLKDSMGRCRCRHSKRPMKVGVLLVLLRIGLIVFIATLGLYVADPLLLAVIGLCCIIGQLILRALSTVVFPDYRVHSEADEFMHHVDGDEKQNEERKWPNTTHAQAMPAIKDPEDATNRTSDEQPISSDD